MQQNLAPKTGKVYHGVSVLWVCHSHASNDLTLSVVLEVQEALSVP